MQKSKSASNVVMDRLSELPDPLILEILSLVGIRDVVRTTLLSKRWNNLWITTPCLRFSDVWIGTDIAKIRNFVYRTLTLWSGTHLREFNINFRTDCASVASLSMDMALWVHFATTRKVEDLCIELHCPGSLYSPPQCLYEYLSIKKLSLYGCNLQIRGDLKWDRLNELKLSNCVISGDVMNRVFSSSPQLQTLTVICGQIRLPQSSLSIRSSSLKKLWIGYHHCNPSVLTIWAPNLRELKYSGTPHVKCLLTDISSLIEVHLDFSSGMLPAVKEALLQILPVIQNVETVRLSVSCFKALGYIQENDPFSPLSNVKLLTIDSWAIELSNVDCIAGLLECFPKLKMLIINWKFVDEEFKVDAEKLLELKPNLLELRTVVIRTRYVYKASSSQFTVFLLKHAAVIEKMVIRREGVVNSDELFEAAKKLMSLQRSFPNVELVIC